MDVGVPILGDTQDFEIYVSAYSVENGWVAGGCWDDDITNVMKWIIPENSLLG